MLVPSELTESQIAGELFVQLSRRIQSRVCVKIQRVGLEMKININTDRGGGI